MMVIISRAILMARQREFEVPVWLINGTGFTVESYLVSYELLSSLFSS